jgi:uncharacterized protein (DUF58 family)
LGLLRRTQVWTGELTLIVHPTTVALAELGTGFVRDLEGQESTTRSDSDVSFESLRPYETGDDRRQIHWLSTARTGQLMVRQYVDTRRSHAGLLVDGDPKAYESEVDFETAVSVAASLGARVLLDDQQVTCLVGSQRVPSTTRSSLLDGLSSIEFADTKAGLGHSIAQLTRMASGMSVAFVVTGSHTTMAELRRISLRFPAGVRVLVTRVDPDSRTSFQPLGIHLLLSLRSLEELGHLVWAVQA